MSASIPNREPTGSVFDDQAAYVAVLASKRAIAAARVPAMSEAESLSECEPAGDGIPESGTPKKTDAETIKRLAAMSPLEYDRIRRDAAKQLLVRPATLDKMVGAERKGAADDNMGFPDVEPWASSVDPGALLSEISATVRRFIICQQETADAVALWVGMTWFMDVVQIAPLAIITAPEKRCGKSQLLFLLGKLSYRPLTASNISPAALFRAVDAWKPTLLVDEADAFMRDNEELRGIINAGHTRDSAYVVRTVGDDFTPTRFSVWGAKALAGIGHLADTLMDRAIVLELRRKMSHENAERLRHAEPELFDTLAEKLARFADDCRDDVRRARPELPASLNDRAQDNWEPLLAIADIAGGVWPVLGRKAALKLSGTDAPTMSTGTELLADIHEVFEIAKVDRLSTAQLIEGLCSDDERPWATYNRGKPISPRQVSKRLGEYGISSTTIRVGLEVFKGFRRVMFEEAFSRYLVAPPVPSVTTLQTSGDAGLRVTDHPQRYGNEIQPVTPKPLQHKACNGVTDTGGVSGEIIEVEA
jgi:putative DNA primase/helicase